jgi:hypothetical protein
LLTSRISYFCVLLLLTIGVNTVIGQDAGAAKEPAKETDKKKEAKKDEKKASKDAPREVTAEQVVEASIIVYAYPAGRDKMLQIRKTETERGKLVLHEADGKTTNANYQRWVSRPEAGKVKFRLDQELPTATFAMVQTPEKVFGIYNDQAFQPREDAVVLFQNRLIHSIDALLWYKENGSKISLAGREKVLGVEFYLIDLTDKNDRKTRFFVSVKSFRVMLLEYESVGVKYVRKFRDYKYSQGVLVPFASELKVGDKIIEEQQLGTVTFGQKLDETLFAAAG